MAATAGGAAPSMPVGNEHVNAHLASVVSDESSETLARMACACRGWWKAARFQAGYRSVTFQAHDHTAWQVVPLSARNSIASAGVDGEVKLWQSGSGRALRTLQVPCDCGFAECDGRPVKSPWGVSQIQALYVSLSCI